MKKLRSSKVGILFLGSYYFSPRVLGFPKQETHFPLPETRLSLSPRDSPSHSHFPTTVSPSSGHLRPPNRSQNVHQASTYNPRQVFGVESKCVRRNQRDKNPKTQGFLPSADPFFRPNQRPPPTGPCSPPSGELRGTGPETSRRRTAADRRKN